ncbi:MAG: dephospho-CoA kinase [Methylothermaceae bacteria B42]|nr:MAG: dephospho-CoA kinase [Methylothermaceae bacteria B42]HHJ39916.1 dephospho-CoA kinase [Methylothermaceae bacterium]
MLKIGLTGGIASGKSTVEKLFEKRGITVIDADKIARNLVKPGQPPLDSIVETFGRSMLLPDGNLDRAKLRELVFNHPRLKEKLEAILHPAVYVEMARLAKKSNSPYVIFSIPLLVETGAEKNFHRILVIDCPEALQIARLKQRDNLQEDMIKQILQNQATRPQRLAVADDVIVNDGSLAKLEQQVEELHQFYLRLSRNQTD